MLQVRMSCFETNSSSANTIILLTEKEFSRWKNDEIYVDYYKNEVYEKEQIIEKMKADEDYTGSFDDESIAEYAAYELDAFSYSLFLGDADIQKEVRREGMIALGIEYAC